jgi:hypothetical protein
MTKYLQFDSVASTNDELEDLNDFRNLGKYGSNFIYHKSLASAEAIRQVASITGTSSTLYSYPTARASVRQQFVYTDETNTYIVFGYIYGTGPSYIEYFYSSDGGSSFTRYSVNFFAGSADVGLFRPFKIGSTRYIGWADPDSSIIAFYTLASSSAIDTVTYGDALSTYMGKVIDGKYYFVYENSSNNLELASIDGTDIVTEQSLSSLTKPTTYNPNVQLFWEQGKVQYIIDEDHFYVRVKQNGVWGSWVSYSDTGTTTNAIVWEWDGTELKIKYIVWKDTIYIVKDQGLPLKIQKETWNAYVGWDNWFANGADTIYQTYWEDL